MREVGNHLKTGPTLVPRLVHCCVAVLIDLGSSISQGSFLVVLEFRFFKVPTGSLLVLSLVSIVLDSIPREGWLVVLEFRS
jgi:hypothetical protein